MNGNNGTSVITYEQAKQDVQTIISLKTAIQQIFDETKRSMDAANNPDISEGKIRDALVEKFRALTPKFEEYVTKIGNLHSMLSNIIASYEQTEQQGATNVENI